MTSAEVGSTGLEDSLLSRKRRSGAFLTILSLFVGLLGLFLIMVENSRSQLGSNWARRVRSELQARDVLNAAVTEATHEVMKAVNDPTSQLFHEIRASVVFPVGFVPALIRTRLLARELNLLDDLAVEVEIYDRQSLDLVYEPLTEWTGLMEVRASVGISTGSGRANLSEVREIRSSIVAPPRPLDRYCFFDWARPRPGQIRRAFDLSREQWSEKAPLRVTPGPDGTIQPAFDALQRLLPVLNGVVSIQNAPGDPLLLRGLTFRGRGVLVIEGPVEISDVRLDDASRDRLTIVAFGNATLSGVVEAAIVLTHSQGDPMPRRVLGGNLEVLGSLSVTSGDYSTPGFVLDCRVQPTSAGSNPVNPKAVFVSVSPEIMDRRLEL